MESSEFKHIVRIVGTDIDGEKKVHLALTRIKGVGNRLSRALVRSLKIDENMKIGELDDSEIERLDNILSNLTPEIVPPFLMNRRKDMETGKNIHVVGGDIALYLREDVNRMRKIRCYRGIRHELGLKVRGQRTKSTGRKGAALGVIRKKR